MSGLVCVLCKEIASLGSVRPRLERLRMMSTAMLKRVALVFGTRFWRPESRKVGPSSKSPRHQIEDEVRAVLLCS